MPVVESIRRYARSELLGLILGSYACWFFNMTIVLFYSLHVGLGTWGDRDSEKSDS